MSSVKLVFYLPHLSEKTGKGKAAMMKCRKDLQGAGLSLWAMLIGRGKIGCSGVKDGHQVGGACRWWEEAGQGIGQGWEGMQRWAFQKAEGGFSGWQGQLYFVSFCVVNIFRLQHGGLQYCPVRLYTVIISLNLLLTLKFSKKSYNI